MDIPAADELEWLESNSLLPEFEDDEEDYIVVEEDERIAGSREADRGKFTNAQSKILYRSPCDSFSIKQIEMRPLRTRSARSACDRRIKKTAESAMRREGSREERSMMREKTRTGSDTLLRQRKRPRRLMRRQLDLMRRRSYRGLFLISRGTACRLQPQTVIESMLRSARARWMGPREGRFSETNLQMVGGHALIL